MGLVVSSVEVSAGDEGRMWGVKYIAGRWYAMMVKSMGSGSVWNGQTEVDGEMSCVVSRVTVGGRGKREDEGRRCGEELGCGMQVYRIV